jgi:hypothetical protein
MKASGMLAIRIRIFHQQRFGKKKIFSAAVQRDTRRGSGKRSPARSAERRA